MNHHAFDLAAVAALCICGLIVAACSADPQALGKCDVAAVEAAVVEAATVAEGVSEIPPGAKWPPRLDEIIATGRPDSVVSYVYHLTPGTSKQHFVDAVEASGGTATYVFHTVHMVTAQFTIAQLEAFLTANASLFHWISLGGHAPVPVDCTAR